MAKNLTVGRGQMKKAVDSKFSIQRYLDARTSYEDITVSLRINLRIILFPLIAPLDVVKPIAQQCSLVSLHLNCYQNSTFLFFCETYARIYFLLKIRGTSTRLRCWHPYSRFRDRFRMPYDQIRVVNCPMRQTAVRRGAGVLYEPPLPDRYEQK